MAPTASQATQGSLTQTRSTAKKFRRSHGVGLGEVAARWRATLIGHFPLLDGAKTTGRAAATDAPPRPRQRRRHGQPRVSKGATHKSSGGCRPSGGRPSRQCCPCRLHHPRSPTYVSLGRQQMVQGARPRAQESDCSGGGRGVAGRGGPSLTPQPAPPLLWPP